MTAKKHTLTGSNLTGYTCSRCNKRWSAETPLQEIADIACTTNWFTVGSASLSQGTIQDGQTPGIGYLRSIHDAIPPKETDEPEQTFSFDTLASLTVSSVTFKLDSEQQKAFERMFGPFLNRDILLSHVGVYMGLDFATVDPLLKYHVPTNWVCVITHDALKDLLEYVQDICPPDRYGTYNIPHFTGRATILVKEYDDPWCYMSRESAKEKFPEAFADAPRKRDDDD